MTKIVTDKSEQIAELCRKYGVRRLELFGSAVRDDFQPERSDLDFAVEFETMTPGRHFDVYFDLTNTLEALFGRHVDLVELNSAKNPYFLKSVNAQKQQVYVAP